jgi:hypothetical protein
MLEKVIWSNSGGAGFIIYNEVEEKYILKGSVELHGLKLTTGDLTDLDGLFTKPIRFAGLLKDEHTVMCFHTGDEEDLFELRQYYYCFWWISPTRIFNKYSHNAGRDFNWVKGDWK